MLRPVDYKKSNSGGKEARFTFIITTGYGSSRTFGSETTKTQLPIPRLNELPPVKARDNRRG